MNIHRNRCAPLPAAIAATLALVAVSTAATTLERMPLGALSRAARAIVRARCLRNSTAWDAGEIWTFTSFEVEEAWSGSTPRQITVRLLGGRAGNLTSLVSGVPRFRPGEEVVLLLETTRRGDYSVAGWELGTFRIRRDPLTGQERITQDTAGFATLDPASHRFHVEGIRDLPLEAFRTRIMAALRRGEETNP